MAENVRLATVRKMRRVSDQFVSSCGEVRVSVATAAELMRELLNEIEILIATHP
jgi:hypothetical protein